MANLISVSTGLSGLKRTIIHKGGAGGDSRGMDGHAECWLSELVMACSALQVLSGDMSCSPCADATAELRRAPALPQCLVLSATLQWPSSPPSRFVLVGLQDTGLTRPCSKPLWNVRSAEAGFPDCPPSFLYGFSCPCATPAPAPSRSSQQTRPECACPLHPGHLFQSSTRAFKDTVPRVWEAAHLS